MFSGGAKALGLRAGILRATRRQVERHGDFDYIINWGRSERRFNGEYVNDPEAVALASNKLDSARALGSRSVPQPDFTTDVEVVEGWLRHGDKVVARRLLRANSGRGIVLLSPEEDPSIPSAGMYTKYIPKSTEFRVHVVAGRIIDYQEKKRRTDCPDSSVNWQIRNSRNGFVFARGEVSLPDCVGDAALAAVDALKLDFGAVDVGYNAKRDKCRVYEVNTAPGLEGTTLDKYYEAFLERFPALRGGMYEKRRRAVNETS